MKQFTEYRATCTLSFDVLHCSSNWFPKNLTLHLDLLGFEEDRGFDTAIQLLDLFTWADLVDNFPHEAHCL